MDFQYPCEVVADSYGTAPNSVDLQAALLHATFRAGVQQQVAQYPAAFAPGYGPRAEGWDLEAALQSSCPSEMSQLTGDHLYELRSVQQALTPAHALLLEAELLKAAALQSMSDTLSAKRARLSALAGYRDAGLWDAQVPTHGAQHHLQLLLQARAEEESRRLRQSADRARKSSDGKRSRSGRSRGHKPQNKGTQFTARQPAWAGSDWHPMAAVAGAPGVKSDTHKTGGTGVFLPQSAAPAPTNAPAPSSCTSEASVTAPTGKPTSCSSTGPAGSVKASAALTLDTASSGGSFELAHSLASKQFVLESSSRSSSLTSSLSSGSAGLLDRRSANSSLESWIANERALLASGSYSCFGNEPVSNVCPQDPLQNLRWKAAQSALPDEWSY